MCDASEPAREVRTNAVDDVRVRPAVAVEPRVAWAPEGSTSQFDNITVDVVVFCVSLRARMRDNTHVGGIFIIGNLVRIHDVGYRLRFCGGGSRLSAVCGGRVMRIA